MSRLSRLPAMRPLMPFLATALLGLLLTVVPQSPSGTWQFFVSLALTGLAAVTTFAAPWDRLPAWTRVGPAMTYVIAVAFLRDATGGPTGGLGPLVLLPVFWLALHGTRAQLAVVLAGVVAVFYVPMLLVGAPHYPATGWRTGAIFVSVAAVIGYTVQALVLRLREIRDEHADLARQFEQLATTDALTSLANRRRWELELDRAMEHSRTTSSPLSLAVLDLDRFKRVNDSRGHHYGDRVLRAAAEAWSAELRPGDTLARLGGEEFGLLLLDCPVSGALTVTDRVRGATPFGQTASAGVVQWDGAETIGELLARADVLLYEAKRRGRDRSVGGPPTLALAR